MSDIGTLLGHVPAGDWERLTDLYDSAQALDDIDSGLNKVANEMGILWKALKHDLTQEQLDQCFSDLFVLLIEGDLLTPLNEAYESIQLHFKQAEHSRELLVRAATISGLEEGFYLDYWQDGEALCADLVEIWEQRFGVDIIAAYRQAFERKNTDGVTDPIETARKQLSQNLVTAVPVSVQDDILAEILTILTGGEINTNRNMIRRCRRGVPL